MNKCIIVLACLLMGCATIKLPDGTEYRRFGNQELNDISIKAEKPDGSKVSASLGKQDSDPEIVESLKEMRKMSEIIMERLPEVMQ